ncbi:1-acyl-sn-glycerol-3-phosphate acyltransferase [Pseudoroseomonas wenyumeiae]|uniref:1-acyl-sn-glycerol-3-phosphate acyltransferase n=3 Tax=Teichococcus wenyumeiae TaxID=2478470 RepID=A0ABX9VJ62_9PROT|nr:lysophospholipid acyltransferase family protein [Pseudoroseomonas wenyumeiae]RMI20838.1 1-acyl-sn-glycerol-3-phosphate acyltransferase [Pseudoroseomonas wenyumeiae]
MEWQFRPARDTEMSPVARLRSHAREVGLSGLVMQGAWRRGVRAYLRLFHRLEVVGRENLPATPPYVLIANHSSHLDALSLAAMLRGPASRRAFALAAGDTFFTSVGSSAFAAWAVNALPVWRRRTSAKDLNGLRQRLAEDELVFILFPEGTRSRSGAMGRFLPGIGALVAGGAVPVVPCYLEGAHAAWPAGRRWPRPGPLRLRIGPPLDFSATSDDKAGWMEVARRCEDAVRALSPPAPP